MDSALDSALGLSRAAGVFDKGPWGLYGVWGPMVRTWLDELLPDDAHERCSGRVSVLIKKPVMQQFPPRLVQHSISEFSDRSDLIDCCMASVHVPLFLDTRWTAKFRGQSFVDGSLELGTKVRYELPSSHSALPTVKISPFKDPRMRKAYSSEGTDFLKLPSGDPEAAVRQMMEWGAEYAETTMEEEGTLDLLSSSRTSSVEVPPEAEEGGAAQGST